MLFKTGVIFLGFGLFIGFFGTFLQKILVLNNRNKPKNQEYFQKRYNQLLVLTIGLVAFGAVLMILGKNQI